MCQGAPIGILAEVEAAEALPKGTLDAALAWLQRWSPFLIHYKLPFGRRSVEAQLRARTAAAIDRWSSCGYPTEVVERFLKTIQVAMNHPNHFLIPDDPLFLVLTADYDDFLIQTVRFHVKKHFGVDIRTEEFCAMHEEGNWTMGRFARHVLSQCRLGA